MHYTLLEEAGESLNQIELFRHLSPPLGKICRKVDLRHAVDPKSKAQGHRSQRSNQARVKGKYK